MFVSGVEEELSEGPTASEKFLQIHIADNGPGMREEVRSRIFDPFFTTKKSGGSCPQFWPHCC